jgi:hypothetical protein
VNPDPFQIENDEFPEEPPSLKCANPSPPPEQTDVFLFEDDEPPPVLSPSPPASLPNLPSFITKTYSVTRGTQKHLNGDSVYFKMQKNGQNLFTAKFKRSRLSIFNGDKSPRLREQPDAIVLVARNFCDFSFRKSFASKEILTVRFASISHPSENARKMAVNFFVEVEDLPGRKLISKNPKLNDDGKVIHDFEDELAIDSVKNAVLVAQTKGPSLVLIRKMKKDILEIDVRFNHETIWIFVIGIASFLCKAK